jgi:hypothetical protein
VEGQRADRIASGVRNRDDGLQLPDQAVATF